MHRKPNLRRATEVGRASWSTRTLAYASHIALAWSADRPFGEWMEELERYDRAHKGAASSWPPKERPGSGVRERPGATAVSPAYSRGAVAIESAPASVSMDGTLPLSQQPVEIAAWMASHTEDE